MGKCIGEKNKFLYYFYLQFQLVAIINSIYLVIMNVIIIFSSINSNKNNLILHFTTLAILFFFMSTIIYLIIFQTFLFYKNLTVCNIYKNNLFRGIFVMVKNILPYEIQQRNGPTFLEQKIKLFLTIEIFFLHIVLFWSYYMGD